MAESALGDVENLRRLLLHSFLPCRDSKPEDDLTPTPSEVGHSQHRGLAPTGQEEPSEGPSASALPGPPEPDAQGATRDPGPGEGLEQVGLPLAQAGAQQLEAPSGYLVVRKGNTFYLSLLAHSGEPQAAAESVGEAVGALSRAPSLPSCQEGTRETPAGGLSPAEFQGMRDADAIFQTIEQLALKLTKLKDLEGAYRQLLLQGRFTAEASPGQGSTSLPEPGQMSPSTRRGSRDSHPSPQSPVAAKPEVNGLSLALPEDSSQEATL